MTCEYLHKHIRIYEKTLLYPSFSIQQKRNKSNNKNIVMKETPIIYTKTPLCNICEPRNINDITNSGRK